jgi:poly(beta-D-mannuronate) lyase
MTRTLRRLLPLAIALTSLFAASVPGNAMTVEERKALDLSIYSVTNPGASFFDVLARKDYVQSTKDPVVRKQVAKLATGASCQTYKALPPITGSLLVPMFYHDRDGWDVAAEPFIDFENGVTLLAGSQFVAKDTVSGQCLLDVLSQWAKQGAFLDLQYQKDAGLQTWFQAEGSLLAASIAYSIVRPQVQGADDQKKAIEDWLVAAALHHGTRVGADDGSCCNNHFYRRAAYSAMIGVLAGDNDMFRTGISAIYSALSEASPEGALPREMKRGQMAARYQNYAVTYLVFIAQVARMQGYDMFGLKVNGHTLDDIVHLAVGMLKDPQIAGKYSAVKVQQTEFSRQKQYAAWLEYLPGLSQRAGETADDLASRRPLYNRTVGGYLSLYLAAAPGS